MKRVVRWAGMGVAALALVAVVAALVVYAWSESMLRRRPPGACRVDQGAEGCGIDRRRPAALDGARLRGLPRCGTRRQRPAPADRYFARAATSAALKAPTSTRSRRMPRRTR